MKQVVLDKTFVFDESWVASNGNVVSDVIYRPSTIFRSNPLLSVRASNMKFINVHCRNWEPDWYPLNVTKELWGASFHQGGPSRPELGNYNPWLYGWHTQAPPSGVLENVEWLGCSVVGFPSEGWSVYGPTKNLRFTDCYAHHVYAGIEFRWSGQAQFMHDGFEVSNFYGHHFWAPPWWRDDDPYGSQLEVPEMRGEAGKGVFRFGGCRNAKVLNSREEGATGGIKIYGPTDNLWIQGCETCGLMWQHSVGSFHPVRNVWFVRNQVHKSLGLGYRFAPGANISGDVHALFLNNLFTNTWKFDGAVRWAEGNGVNLNLFDGKLPNVWMSQNIISGFNGMAGVKDAVGVKVTHGAQINPDFESVNFFPDQIRKRG